MGGNNRDSHCWLVKGSEYHSADPAPGNRHRGIACQGAGGTVSKLAQNIRAQLDDSGLQYGECEQFATPRRLAVMVQQVPVSRSGSSKLRTGPALAVARDKDGSWSAAARGFARSCNVAVEQLQVVKEGKTERVACTVTEPEQRTAELLPGMVSTAITQLKFSRSMRWGTCEQAFLRPVRWLLLLHGSTCVEFEMFNIRSSAYSYGHRQHHPQAIAIEHADNWQQQLQQAKVMPCMRQRQQRIVAALDNAAKDAGRTLHAPEQLLQEVNCLVEWPVVIHGSFDKSYLQLPEVILLGVMQKHQRYFPLYQDSKKQKLAPEFIAVAALESSNSSVVVRGNENVLRPRLADARFFWQRDCKVRLEQRLPALEGIIFHSRLGSIADHSRQLAATAAAIATELGLDPALASRAGQLCKCDLVSDTVGEFPELQGSIGALLAANDGEQEQVVQAIAEHYRPTHATDDIASSAIARVVALADKLTLVAGIFSVNDMPTADKDPYSVRRAAIGILRTIIEADINIGLDRLLAIATEPFNCNKPVAELIEFFTERLRVICIEAGAQPQVVDAVLAVASDNPLQVKQRIEAMRKFTNLPQAAQLIAAHKRVRNILRQAGQPGDMAVQREKLEHPAERELQQQLGSLQQQCELKLKQGDYQAVLQSLAAMQPAVNTFFDEVKVMADDSEVRDNRLALLGSMEKVFNAVADLSRLDG